jgi:hypothetical protein
LCDGANLATGHRGGVDVEPHRAVAVPAAGDEQRRFRESVRGPERRPSETALMEHAMECLERSMTDRLGSVERNTPGGEVQRAALLRPDAAYAEVVGEVRAAAVRGLQPGDRLEPARGALEKRGGGH